MAVLLVDAQLLLDNAGQEEAYLKSLFYNYRTGLENLRDETLDDGKPLVVFPRIWIVALSKSDLMPEVDVQQFKELIIEKGADDLDRLRRTIASMVEAPEALAVGEDFLLLSSAKFSPREIKVTQRVGIDRPLPIAAVLPFERHVRWARAQSLPHRVAEQLLDNAGKVAAALTVVAPFVRRIKLPGPVAAVGSLLAGLLSKDVIDRVVGMGRAKLEEAKAEALARHDYLTAVLMRFRIDLEDGERSKILLRSLK